MIRHHIENLPHSVLCQRASEESKIMLGAKIGVQHSRIDNVVAMQTPRYGL